MKILVTAYACDPYRGSEPGVGWAAVCRIARKHDVWVLADIHNKEGWERGASEGIIPSNVHVRFLRDLKTCSSNRFIAHLQSWMNYASFNRQILEAAAVWHKEIGFDLCHQVTIAAWRMPSPLWRLPIPFVWGPIGGAGYIPPGFRSMLSLQARVFETARDVNTAVSIRSRAFNDCITNTAVVFAANEETESLLAPFRKGKPLVRLPIASISLEKATAFQNPNTADHASSPLRLFAGGNMEGRKGVSLALKALKKVAEAGIDFRYTVAGGGPEVPSLIQLSKALGLERQVEFHPGFSGNAYIAALQAIHVYFLPSFRESTPVTLLEAYLAGCYPVVADTSAQGEIVRMAGGIAVPVTNIDTLVQGLADGIIWCSTHRDQLPALNHRSIELITEYFSSSRYDQALDDAYALAMNQQPARAGIPSL